MKRTALLLTAIACLVFDHDGLCQTSAEVSTGGMGWKRIAYVDGGNGRGFGKVTLLTKGGSYRPIITTIDWFHDWSAGAGINLRSESIDALYWSGARITNDGTNSYIEVQFKTTVSTLTVISDNYGWRAAKLYTGTLPSGGGTVRASASVAKLNVGNYFMVNYNGNVGIGTTTPAERLSVNGNIRAKEIKVETANWPDYVFDEEYPLQPLDELAEYIRVHKHLPGIPKAEQAETEGISLGEMNTLLLKKVEELTLYLMEQNRENQAISRKNEEFERRINKLEQKNRK